MKHIKLFEDTSPRGRYPDVTEYLSIDADNDSEQVAFLKKKADLDDQNTKMIKADFLVRGADNLLSAVVEAGLDSSRYGGAIKEAIEALKPALRKIQEIQYK